MGFEPLDASALGSFSLEDLAEAPPVLAPQFQQQVAPVVPSPGQVATGYVHRYGPPVLIGGVIGYFVYGWTGALIGALVGGVGYFLISSFMVMQALGAAFNAG